MTDQPLGIIDLLSREEQRLFTVHAELGDFWFWCRKHSPRQGPVHVSKECKGAGGYLPTGDLPGDGCVKIGPFMSEREANRLNGDPGIPAVVQDLPPLGMEVEQ